MDHSQFNYNTQDGLDVGHLDSGSCTGSVTNSSAVGNSGQTFKWGANVTHMVFVNNFAERNCLRMAYPLGGGIPDYYGGNLGALCRVGDNISYNFRDGGYGLIAFNTLVGYAATDEDVNCWDNSCPTATWIHKNNLFLGYDNPTAHGWGEQSPGPGVIELGANGGTIPITQSNDLWYRHRNCIPSATETCTIDPLLVGEPTGNGSSFVETELDDFNFYLSTASPAAGAGVAVAGVTTDF